MNTTKGILQSVGRAVEVLKCFAEHGELGVTEVSKLMDLHKSTTYGLIATLEAYKLLERSAVNEKYKLGIELFRLGTKVKIDLKEIASPYLEQLANHYKETVHLVIRDDCHVLYLDKIESPHSMRICSRVGERLPLFCTGVGKAILANLDEHEIKSVLDRTKLTKCTEHTIVKKNQLIEHLKKVQEQGYAEDSEELELGLHCIAAPIFDCNSKPLAAISVAGPVFRMTQEIQQEIIKTLIEVTSDISQKLGCQPKLSKTLEGSEE
ncbi:IclR family transcriptional regulator [Clostridium formicaceticum]|uniref:Transcriptional regulator KdgR n=1 Tax=Clostridium formicaceticum TaxID=1497 RepID=A0AAC9WHW8_9CLOT|nr:IclR family transcriptional regulator [Clostridium formicaceticum]AOY74971.1 hypothetical protein BJL90_02745 [Clostridium formicaceticum]ARE89383.1 Transcriptional regulator KdgR [Clostridium formicaceticum]